MSPSERKSGGPGASAAGILREQTARSLISLKRAMDLAPQGYWERAYCGMPLWKHIYHTLHSLDRWYVNPERYEEPEFHTLGLNDLDLPTKGSLSRHRLEEYRRRVFGKILSYLQGLDESDLAECPQGCANTRLELILAQHRHLDMHIGMLMGFLIAGEGVWPPVLGLRDEIPWDEL